VTLKAKTESYSTRQLKQLINDYCSRRVLKVHSRVLCHTMLERFFLGD